jgi:hypothetical protein
MNQANRSGDSGKVEMLAFDHPWSEHDDLLCRERLLRNQSPHDGIADLQHGRQSAAWTAPG